ncbi:S66 peptidase family protein [Bythopirellula goksoeyrii]|uniref:Putative murein peptide carboxypeptidase n=1 Tax=Bythopirellula goksoeyrii TaxID=1400387 RepID=A0A5B9QHR5_9BACT|nr:LD-carboxypeptidase [Bythopirellula goksoeyrii]QEG33663.1 putative murein peptide carboxypeptidase [Bythopirellula goksoeyrii]
MNHVLCIWTFIYFIVTSACSAQERQTPSWPKLLQPGDTIMFVAPAGVVDRDQLMLAKKRLEERGYHVIMRDDLFSVEGYLAGSDERRAEELMQAFRDPEVDAIFPARGGYGVMRILELLDFDVIRQNPKLVTGFSDITALHSALNKQAGLISFHSPNPTWGLGSEENLPPFAAKYFFRAVEENPEGPQDYVIEIPADVPQPVSLGTGTTRGRLTGGNLSLIAALEGTPYGIDTQDAILLIEDIGEAPYRIDRMLQQLKLTGKLNQIRGAILGQFTKTEEREENEIEDPRFSAEGVLRQYFEPLGIPVLMNFPIGHHEMNCTLPLGGEVEIDANKGTLTVMGAKP